MAENSEVTIKKLEDELGRLRMRLAELEKGAGKPAGEKGEEGRCRATIENSPIGYAYVRMVYEGGRPVDIVILEINKAFVRLTGLKDVTGKKVTEIYPSGFEISTRLFELFNRVAMGGELEKFEIYSPAFKTWFSISVSSAGQGYFTAWFEVITGRKQAEEALQKSEECFHSLVDQAPVAILITRRGFPIYGNALFIKMMGLQNPKELEQKPVFEFFAPQYREESKERTRRRALGHPVENEFEAVLQKADGCQFPAHIAVATVQLADGPARVSFVSDISESKQAEEALAKSEAFLKSVVENIPSMIFIKDAASLEFVSLNIAEEKLLGLKKEEVIGKNDYDLFSKEAADGYVSKDREVLNNRQLVDIPEEVIQTKHLGEVILHTKKIPLYNSQGVPQYLLGISEDITERKRAEEALRASESRWRAVFDNAGMGIALVDHEGHPIQTNAAFHDMLGYNQTELSKMNFMDFTHPEDADKDMALFRELMEKKRESYQMEKRYFRKDGETIWANLNVTVLRDESGRPEFALGFVKDITESKRSEEALRENQARLDLALQSAGMGVWEWDIETDKRRYDDQECCLLGIDPAAFDGSLEHFFAAVHPDDREGIRESQERTLKFNAPYESNFRAVWQDGSIHQIVSRGMVVRNENGQPPKLTGIAWDNTKPKQVEDALRESEKIMRYIIQYDPNAVAIYDQNLNYIAVSDRYLQDYNVQDENIIGKHHYEVFPEMPQKWRDVHQRVLAGAIERNDDDYFERTDGSITYNRWECRPWYQADGAIGGMITYTEVTTESKLAEMALRESEERYRLLFHSMENGFALHEIICDGQGVPCDYRFLEVNPAFEKLTGMKAENIVGRTNMEVLPGTEKEWIERYGKVALGGGETHFENYSREMGRYFEVTAYSPRPGQFAVIFQDVTERKLITEKMIQSQKLADLGTLAAGMAHEINTPLQIITGSSDTLLDKLEKGGGDFAGFKSRLDRINQSAWRVAEIVRAMLTYARNKNDEVAPANLNELVRDTLLLTEHQMHVWSNIEVSTDLAKDIPDFLCDRNKIIQVLINLLTNARDAMPQGGRLTIRTAYDPQTRRVSLEVSDTGEGIPVGARSKIFDPFFTTKPLGQGTGLGLSIVMGIVRSHGGEITIGDAQPHGAVLTLYLPEEPPGKADEGSESSQAEGRYRDGES